MKHKNIFVKISEILSDIIIIIIEVYQPIVSDYYDFSVATKVVVASFVKVRFKLVKQELKHYFKKIFF
jgi:hypothetical protein